MSELIDRQALKDAVKRYAGEPIKQNDRKCQAICLDMLGTIDAQPTIDAVEVVRCGECKFNYANMIHDPLDDADYTDITCTYWMSDGVHPKDYCSKGARMDGERRKS